MMLFSLKSLVFNLQDKKLFSILTCGMNNWPISYKRSPINLIIIAIFLKIKRFFMDMDPLQQRLFCAAS